MPTSLRSRLRVALVPHGWHREDLQTAGVLVGIGLVLGVADSGSWLEPIAYPPSVGIGIMLVFGGLATALGPNLRTAMVCFALALVGTALGGFHSFSVWLVFQAVFAIVSHAPERISALVQRASLVVTTLAALLTFTATLAFNAAVQVGLLVAALTIIPSLWAANVREQKVLAATERARADAQEEARRLAEEAASDRARLEIEQARAESARDLHDLVASHVSAIALQSQAAARTGDEGRRSEILSTVHTSAVLALGELRRMIDVMRGGDAKPVTSVDETLGLAGAAGVRIEGEAALRGLTSAQESALRPVIAEITANVLKHATRRELTITREGTAVAFSNPATRGGDEGEGYGLTNMRERLAELGGGLSHRRTADTWTTSIDLPREEAP